VADRNERRPAPNVVAAIMAEPWFILESGLQQIIAIAERTNLDVEAIETQRGEELRSTRSVTLRDGIATIPVRGPLFRYANVFTRISGATSYADFAMDFTTAMKDPDVRGVLLTLDSPGGMVNGAGETSRLIATARGVKPVDVYVGGTSASAGYMVASGARQIYIDSMGIAGSIGAVLRVRKNEDDGATEIVSSQSPKKIPDLNTPEGRAIVGRMVDALAQQFVEIVAEHRGVSVETVLADFGQGDVFVGQQAVDAGLVDGVSSYETVLAQMIDETRPATRTTPTRFAVPSRPSTSPGARSTSTTETPMADKKDPAVPGAEAPGGTEIKKVDAPASAAPVDLNAVRSDAAKAERERIKGIEALKKPGNEKMIEACLDDTSCSIEMAKARLYDHERAIASAQLAALQADESKTPKPKSASAPANEATAATELAAGKKAAQFFNQTTGRSAAR
jgi:ClpP class serine protease